MFVCFRPIYAGVGTYTFSVHVHITSSLHEVGTNAVAVIVSRGVHCMDSCRLLQSDNIPTRCCLVRQSGSWPRACGGNFGCGQLPTHLQRWRAKPSQDLLRRTQKSHDLFNDILQGLSLFVAANPVEVGKDVGSRRV